MTKKPDFSDAHQFINSVADFSSLSAWLQTELLLLFVELSEPSSGVTATRLAELRKTLRLKPHERLPQYLSANLRARSGGTTPHLVKADRGYALERSYAEELKREYLGRASARSIASDLRTTLSTISDPKVQEYLDEAVRCFECQLFRAAVVMTWCATYSVFRKWIFDKNLSAFNVVASTWKIPFTIRKIDDFQDLLEATVIDTARKAGLITKEQQKTLKQLLDQRNSFAHPSHKPITSSISEAYIETALQEIVQQFG